MSKLHITEFEEHIQILINQHSGYDLDHDIGIDLSDDDTSDIEEDQSYDG